ncbi:hypothetical protein BZA05DRAFT_385427 [Tricharina praecox]|uniref:uncharacterized protein n=1 Tax=Tricharina praecox TaxID=43433 RepID=UPI00221F5CD7|nr:uncharacterized protein BZA05DRAFT_385427 [Tricharina praecox]KAI5857969.1 hypothetical protein BZA05DRAFT_385427 [Tricharina praecox]
MIFPQLLTLLLLAVTVAARCTIREDTDFTLTTFNATSPSLNNTLLTVSTRTVGPVGIHLPSPLLAHFHAGGLYRRVVDQKKVFMYQGYLTPAGGLEFAAHPPANAVTGPFEIGCDYYGRHFLSVKGKDDWSACRLSGSPGRWKIVSGAKKDKACSVRIRWLWVDYVQ